MNAVSIFALSVLGHITALAQGTIDFRNHVDDVQPKVDAPFFDQRGVPLEGSNYVAQLYIWYPYPEYHFIPVGRKAVFMTNGYFQATNFQDVTVELPPPFQRGARVWIQVRAWQPAFGTTFEESALAGDWTGVSEFLFVDGLGGGGSPPGLPAPLWGLKYPGTPLIIRQPKNQIISSNLQTTLDVLASSGVQMFYQWYQEHGERPDGLITGATNATYTTPPLGTNTTYWVTVSNSTGTAISDKATITIGSPPPQLAAQLADGLPELTITAPPGPAYRIEAAAHLGSTNWTTLATLKSQTNPFSVVDRTTSSSSVRFYRVVTP